MSELLEKKAFDIVYKHFELLGGKISDVDITFKETKLWKQAKLHALITVDELLNIESDWLSITKQIKQL